MPHYDLVLFDFDGTLADSFDWFWRVMPEVCAKFGLRALDPAQRERYRAMSARAIMAHVGVRWWQAPAIARYARQRMQAEIDTIAVFPGVPALLRQLRAAAVRLAVVSSNSEDNVRRVLGPAAAVVDHFGCGAPILGKRGRTRRALRAMGVAPARALSVGDELRDGDVAREVGVAFLPVAWGYTLPAAFRDAGWAEPAATPQQIADRVLGT